MNQNNNYVVYCHICPNSKKYYGMTKDIKRRWKGKGCGYKKQCEFYEAITEFGWDNIEHTIIADNLTKEEAELLEEELIRDNMTYDSSFGYNKYIGSKLTEEYKAMISETMSGENNSFYGKHHTEESKRKMSIAKSGENAPMYGRTGVNHPLYGCTGEDSPNHKKVICITTMMVFDCIKDGANYYGAHYSHIGSCCRGERKSCGKLSDGTPLVWKYLNVIEL